MFDGEDLFEDEGNGLELSEDGDEKEGEEEEEEEECRKRLSSKIDW